jgi:dienelactone hydrolase
MSTKEKVERMSIKRIFVLFFFLSYGAPAHAAVVGQTIEYKHNDSVLEAYLAYDEAIQDKRPGILVVHEWKGIGDYAKRRATMLAELGYVAFAADMYGKGIRPQTHEEAAKQAGIYKNDRTLMRARIQAALDVLKSHPLVNPEKIGAVGYCFGGTTVLELARSGTDVKGVVSFHGSLATPNLEDAKNIKAKILICHGADDKFIPASEIDLFKKEMKDAGVDIRFESYEEAVHSFTVAEAGSDPSKGMAYNETADKKSWESMKTFLKEVLR